MSFGKEVARSGISTMNRQPLIRIGQTAGKHQVRELAIFGGLPLFSETLHVGAPNVGDRRRFLQRMADILDRNWLTNDGPCVTEFERRIRRITGARHCIATSNGTLGLELAARALEMKDEVIVPSFTFVATAHALRWQGITPVFCDVDPETLTIDPENVEKLITPRTTGILAVHLWGRACDTDALARIAERRGLKLLYDASHAFGCTRHGHPIGQFGDAEVFSFHATKFVNTFEGGAITTNNDELATKLRLMKNFGFTGADQVDYLGINGKMSEPAAAMGLTSLESMGEFIRHNRENYEAYQQALASIDGVRLLPYPADERNNYQYITIQVDETLTGIDRDDLLRILHAENVLARRYFFPGIHNMEPYRSEAGDHRPHLPVTTAAARQSICLPTGMRTAPHQIEQIGALLQFILEHADGIVRLLRADYRGQRKIHRLTELAASRSKSM